MPRYSPEDEQGNHIPLTAETEQKMPEDKATQSLHTGLQELTTRCSASILRN